MRQWTEIIALHDAAVEAYAAAASSVKNWSAEPKPGKWSAGQITAHLNLAFEAVLCEARGGPSMMLRTNAWQRLLLRYTIMRRLLKGGTFPFGARAPRETRPPESCPDRETAIAEFRRLAAEVRHELDTLHNARSKQRFVHPYFGALTLADGLYVSARHIDHHRAQIEGR